MANSPLSRVENFDRRARIHTHTHTHTLGHASSRKISFYGEQRPTRGLLPPLYRCPPCASIVKYRGPLVGSRKYEQKVERTVWLSRLQYIYIYWYIYSLSITRSFYDRFTRLHRERSVRDIHIAQLYLIENQPTSPILVILARQCLFFLSRWINRCIRVRIRGFHEMEPCTRFELWIFLRFNRIVDRNGAGRSETVMFRWIL